MLDLQSIHMFHSFQANLYKKYLIRKTMNIFGSKSGHLIAKVTLGRFFAAPLHLMFFQSGECQMGSRTRKNHQILQKFVVNEENLAII